MSEPAARGVLITRPEPDASATARRVQALGFAPVIAPLLTVTYRTLALPARVQAILVTSGNSLAALPVANLPLLAVGDATAARARAAGFATVLSANGDATALAGLAASRLDPAGLPLLLASGERQGMALAAALRRLGFSVLRRVAYAAMPVGALPDAARAAIQARTLRAALFLSAETARVLVRLVPASLAEDLAEVDALAIGAEAVDALKPLPWRSIRLARSPTLDEVLALL